MVLRKRVAKSAVAGEVGNKVASDTGSTVNTVENMRNELKFVNEDGNEIDTTTKTVKSGAEETKRRFQRQRKRLLMKEKKMHRWLL